MLNQFLRLFIRRGRLTITYADGSRYSFGEAAADTPDVAVRLTNSSLPLKLAIWPSFYLGEAYMQGQLAFDQGSLSDFLDLCGHNLELRLQCRRGIWFRIATATLRRLQQHNTAAIARTNAAHHYDLSLELYRSFLDSDLQYSCAYFSRPSLSLEQAQHKKKRHIIAKLLLEPGQRVLDIGCGWGGLAIEIARTEKVNVLGVTLSIEQLRIAQQRAAQAGLADRVSFSLWDYRAVQGQFDRIVSVGMFEHVGAPQYRTFFEKVHDLMTDQGVAVLHSIGRMHGPELTSAWIRKHIFPGGYIPALSEVLPQIERAGLWLTDLEILRLHYAKTLRIWRERFLAHAIQLNSTYDLHFRRMWEFYLAASEMRFRYAGLMVFQAQLARKVDTIPPSRNYMFEAETAGGLIAAG
ncbi:MAG: cyclopropane-fatty-acyl-phospholipid synthase family protein [Proteobacteria bacterium]|nr:cyclopropane-fatty-acyl-phospholipid synthase family protein [Pseudomonadota bacterium]